MITAMRKTKLTKKPAAVKARVKTKPPVTAKPKRAAMLPLATGQIWRVGEQNLQVGLIGKLLVHYKLAAPNAIRISNSVGGRTAVEKYLKTNKAVLLKTVPADTVKF
jgi:hypothetical protein